MYVIASPAAAPLPRTIARAAAAASRQRLTLLAAPVRRWWLARQARAEFAAMDARMLRDIGLRRAEPNGQ